MKLGNLFQSVACILDKYLKEYKMFNIFISNVCFETIKTLTGVQDLHVKICLIYYWRSENLISCTKYILMIVLSLHIQMS